MSLTMLHHNELGSISPTNFNWSGSHFSYFGKMSKITFDRNISNYYSYFLQEECFRGIAIRCQSVIRFDSSANSVRFRCFDMKLNFAAFFEFIVLGQQNESRNFRVPNKFRQKYFTWNYLVKLGPAVSITFNWNVKSLYLCRVLVIRESFSHSRLQSLSHIYYLHNKTISR